MAGLWMYLWKIHALPCPFLKCAECHDYVHNEKSTMFTFKSENSWVKWGDTNSFDNFIEKCEITRIATFVLSNQFNKFNKFLFFRKIFLTRYWLQRFLKIQKLLPSTILLQQMEKTFQLFWLPYWRPTIFPGLWRYARGLSSG